jgi:acyl transferase domain-containing protein
VSVDTACSSALVALDIGYTKIRAGLDVALVAGNQLNLIAEPFIAFGKARMLSEDGRCKTFDSTANGYVRGEGCGSAVLKKESLASGSSILALIGGTATNQDGRSSTLTAPNGPSQTAVVLAALDQASVASADLDVVECHGTGTALGDPIEVGALSACLARGRPETHAVCLAAVKSNIGHLEGAAGGAGLSKCVLMMSHHEVPPNIHFQKLNPHIDMENFAATVPTKTINLKGKQVQAGLSSFGFGGTNAHVICVSSKESALGVLEDAKEVDGEGLLDVGWTVVDLPLGVA